MKILTVIGARPQFIKACMLSERLKSEATIQEVLVHTGQHYDERMSDIFFDQLNLPQPDFHLGVGSGRHGKQTGKMLMALEKVMTHVQPDLVLVYGDTNSTLAGGLAAAKLHIPVAHVESGLRSFNKQMPEEINRIVTDHLADMLFCPTHTAVENLKQEGIDQGVYLTGDVMYDAVLHFKHHANQQSTILQTLEQAEKQYYVATIHRAENTDDPERLQAILHALQQLDLNVVLPLHPRTKQKINQFGLTTCLDSSHIQVIEPLHYFDMLVIAAQAKAILTDSGGLQKEAYMLQVPCLTLRDETEWIETTVSGWNQLVGANTDTIIESLTLLTTPDDYPALFGDGKAATHMLDILKRHF